MPAVCAETTQIIIPTYLVLKATISVITFVLICRTLHVGVWSQRPGGKGQEPALCEGLVEVQQLSFEQ